MCIVLRFANVKAFEQFVWILVGFIRVENIRVLFGSTLWQNDLHNWEFVESVWCQASRWWNAYLPEISNSTTCEIWWRYLWELQKENNKKKSLSRIAFIKMLSTRFHVVYFFCKILSYVHPSSVFEIMVQLLFSKNTSKKRTPNCCLAFDVKSCLHLG